MTERKFVVIILTFIVPGSFKSVTDYAKSFSVLSKRLYQRKKIDFSYLKKRWGKSDNKTNGYTTLKGTKSVFSNLLYKHVNAQTLKP